MKLTSLFLGSAAALVAVTGAHAADLPAAPEPVEYVKVCDAFGAGFFYLPGTETCLKIGGMVRADYNWVESSADSERSQSNYSGLVRAEVNLDARTQTDIGLVRAYILERMTIGGTDEVTNGYDTNPYIVNAFVQISNDAGTFTAGRTASFFDFYGSDMYADIIGNDDPTNEVNAAAYTFNFGSGLSATLSVEDSASVARRVHDLFPLAGQQYPDVVANVRADQAWGSFQIMGALHQVRSGRLFNDDGTYDYGSNDSDLGWAAGAGLKLKVPGTMFALNSQATYGHGATGYVTTGNGGPLSDANYSNGVNGSLDLADSWSVRAGISAQLAPKITATLDGTYASVDYSGGEYDYDTWTAGFQLAWQPIAGLTIGGEVEYENLDRTTAAYGDGDRWGGAIRVQRDF